VFAQLLANLAARWVVMCVTDVVEKRAPAGENASLHTRGCPGPILCIQLCFEIRASSFENCREHPGKSFLLIGKSFLFGNNSARASRLYTMDKRNMYADYVIVYLG
jgi:hypothetical protein